MEVQHSAADVVLTRCAFNGEKKQRQAKQMGAKVGDVPWGVCIKQKYSTSTADITLARCAFNGKTAQSEHVGANVVMCR